jgi:hypothetical protein
MGELLCAVAEDRQPYHSARHNLGTLQLVAAARASTEQRGAPQRVVLGLGRERDVEGSKSTSASAPGS